MIYVDPLKECIPTKRWRHGMACHLFCDPTDDLEILHKFAESIGLRRCWFQGMVRKRKMPHYDLTVGMRTRAIFFGAKALDRAAAGEIIRTWHEKRAEEAFLTSQVWKGKEL
jgi:hypothetical protein